MPYNLAILTSQLIIILFLIIPYKNIESISVTGAFTEFLWKSLFANFMKKLDIRKVKYAEKIVDMKP